jgi:hypothetical protein
MRKNAAMMGAPDQMISSNTPATAPPARRTTASGRAIRTNTTRPANYYARPFGSFSAAPDHEASMGLSAPTQPPGFFPALTFLADAMTALPKEVMKHFTLMKEVEAKIYDPTDRLGDFIDNLMEQPVPTRKQTSNVSAPATSVQGLLSLTTNNSTSGSANPSLVNGVAGRQSVQPSIAGSTDGVDVPDSEEERRRRGQYHELRMITHSLLGNLDEKIVVLNEANRVLALQQMRIDSVVPHLDTEISEESRLGSMSHWAYSDNRQKAKAAATGANRPRDVAATNSLAAAANMLHEAEIAQARTDAGREAAGRGKGKGKRVTEHPGDSDFDEKPRKALKVGKGKAAGTAANATGLGITTNGEPGPKRKKTTDRIAPAPAMERQASGQGKGPKGRETPRSTPAIEQPAKFKATKAKPAPTKTRKPLPASTQASPMLASSPLAASFHSAALEVPPNARPQSARLRQNSSATNLRHERVQDEHVPSPSRPSSSAGKTNGVEKPNGKRRNVQETTEEHEESMTEAEHAQRLREASEKLRREDLDMPDASGNEREQPTNSQSGSNSWKGSGRASKVGTPKSEAYPTSAGAGGETMSRVRSTRSKQGNGRDSSSSEPQMQGTGKHKRAASNSHLVKQLAPFNKSPNLDRHRLDDDEEDDESREGEEAEAEEDTEKQEARKSSVRRPVSRRNTANSVTLRTSPAPLSRESSAPASPPPTSTRQTTRSSGRGIVDPAPAATTTTTAATATAEQPAPLPDDDDDDDDSEHDPDDPDEPKYCYCNRGSYGEMIACDNDHCSREWFHLGCTGLGEAPGEEEKWYCRECRPKGRGRGKGSRGGRVGG